MDMGYYRCLQGHKVDTTLPEGSSDIFRYLLENLHMGISPGIEDRIIAGKVSLSELAQLQF